MPEPAASWPVDTPATKPVLLFFSSAKSGRCRRVEGFLAQVLQRRRNHTTFTLRQVDYDAHPELARGYGIKQPPTLLVVEGTTVRARLEEPQGCVEIQTMLAPWLR